MLQNSSEVGAGSGMCRRRTAGRCSALQTSRTQSEPCCSYRAAQLSHSSSPAGCAGSMRGPAAGKREKCSTQKQWFREGRRQQAIALQKPRGASGCAGGSAEPKLHLAAQQQTHMFGSRSSYPSPGSWAPCPLPIAPPRRRTSIDRPSTLFQSKLLGSCSSDSCGAGWWLNDSSSGGKSLRTRLQREAAASGAQASSSASTAAARGAGVWWRGIAACGEPA